MFSKGKTFLAAADFLHLKDDQVFVDGEQTAQFKQKILGSMVDIREDGSLLLVAWRSKRKHVCRGRAA